MQCLGLEEDSGMCPRNLQHLEIQQGGGASQGDKEGMASEVRRRPGVRATWKSRFIFFNDFKKEDMSYHVKPLVTWR